MDMPKRAAVDASPRPDKVSRSARSQAREKPAEDDMGKFEKAGKTRSRAMRRTVIIAAMVRRSF
jgi:hypothetical protein